MKVHARILVVGLAGVGLVLGGAAAVSAQPAPLADQQLDIVTAGAVSVASVTDAAGLGPLVLTGTTSNVVAGQMSTDTQPLGVSAGLADGTAVAIASNAGFATGPKSTATNVQTVGAADGNVQIVSSVNRTVQGAGGVQFQAGWTFVFGAWIGI
jgi:hypothetical protein